MRHGGQGGRASCRSSLNADRAPQLKAGVRPNYHALRGGIMTVAKTAESNVQQAVPFFWVTDMERSVRFYVDGLGFEMTKEWNKDGKLRWCWLELGDAAMMLQEFWKEGQNANLPEGKLGAGVSINFLCKDALAIYRDLASRGVAATRPSVGNRMWVTQVQDPEGYSLSFESPTDVPEETVFSESEPLQNRTR